MQQSADDGYLGRGSVSESEIITQCIFWGSYLTTTVSTVCIVSTCLLVNDGYFEFDIFCAYRRTCTTSQYE